LSKPEAETALKAAGMLWLGLPRAFVAEACGVTQSTLRSWLKQDWWPEYERQAERGHFDRMVGKARLVLDKTMEAGLHEDACARDRKQAFEAAKFLLENKDDNFRPKPQNVEHRHTHTVADRLNALTDAELKAIASGKQPLQLETHQADDGVFEVDFEQLTQESTSTAKPDKPKQVRTSDDGRLILDED
jgi:hypothetical protein